MFIYILQLPLRAKDNNKLNLSYFISKKLASGQKEGFSSTIHTIAIISIAIGLAASIVAFLIMKGFQETVKNKIYGFSGHLVITKFTMSNSQEEQPMNYQIDLYKNQVQYPFIDHIQEYAHKTGLIKTENDVVGVVIKGVGKSFDYNAFKENMVEGEFITFPDSGYASQVVLSRTIADKCEVKVGDNILIHFFQNPPRFRKLKVVGVYETNLSEYYDSKVILADLRMLQRLNDWSDSLAGGLEVFVKDPEKVDDAGVAIGEMMDFDLNIERVSDRYLQVFEWLHLLSRQVNILLGIILTVVCVNMISIILILVMERTQMIGLLKALGARDRFIRSVFVYNGINLVIKGLLLGNAIGLGLCFLQYQFKIFKLNPKDYYMSFVPISWHWEIVLLLNVLMLLIVSLVLLLPTMVISRINPIKAIRFD
ncbi:ABC transporter permease [Chryseosolibacter indicus]|uniref:ABC transporter permease n=1 Tax=Chryseosolibacter indicus TaxID=2782351 RepID=A0ABS5VUA6_9BACT|nr:ABC transporter permease [Chryseosolibacter indicus]MBT1705012.1 ABC transporter permease [Chryseosolibacter indicus]